MSDGIYTVQNLAVPDQTILGYSSRSFRCNEEQMTGLGVSPKTWEGVQIPCSQELRSDSSVRYEIRTGDRPVTDPVRNH